MLTAVLLINVLISLFCFYLAWKVWQLRHVLQQVEHTLTSMERRTHNVLSQAPNFLDRQHRGVGQLRQHYQRLEFQLRQIEQLLALLSLGQRMWRRLFPRWR